MPHIPTPPGLPGIVGLLAFRPATATPLSLLAETLLRGPSSLTSGERELIASYVSARNGCTFCATSHAAAALHLLGGDVELVTSTLAGDENARISPKLKALLAIAGKVREDGRTVTEVDVARARAEGATDLEIHDTVLIAAAFCMFNRYVDGLATWAPSEASAYDQLGKLFAKEGYLKLGK